MEFLQMKRGHCEEENEEEVIRDAGNFPISHSSWSYGFSNHQRLCLAPSFDDAREEDAATTRSYHGATAATKIQEVKLIDLTPTSTDVESSYKKHAGAGAGAGAGLWSMEKEHMFDKVVTPSDVGKLNRLVIPKQHAEKYFPLDSSSANEKVLLLNFEDRYGKPWRFRYSYWNSSQSYVITKGWSRFVKEKKLDAGDIVSFERVRVGELAHKDHRMFIDWRHRSPDHAARDHPTLISPPLQYFPISGSPVWGRLYHPLLPPPPPMSMPMLRPYQNQNQNQNQNQRDHNCGTSTHDYHIATNFGQGLHYAFRSSSSSSAPHDQIGAVPQTGDIHMSNAAAAAAPKRLRLFGVNMDCSVPQESKGIVLPSVPYVTTAASVLYPPPPPPPFSSLRLPPQLRLHDGASMPTLQPEFPGKGHSSRSLSLDI